MSEITNSQGAHFPENSSSGNQENKEDVPAGLSFKGEKTDLRYDPKASVNKTFVDKTMRAKIGNFDVKFGSKEMNQVNKDLQHFYQNPGAVQKATALSPYFQSHAENKGYKNPGSVTMALENYAATTEFVKNSVE